MAKEIKARVDDDLAEEIRVALFNRRCSLKDALTAAFRLWITASTSEKEVSITVNPLAAEAQKRVLSPASTTRNPEDDALLVKLSLLRQRKPEAWRSIIGLAEDFYELLQNEQSASDSIDTAAHQRVSRAARKREKAR